MNNSTPRVRIRADWLFTVALDETTSLFLWSGQITGDNRIENTGKRNKHR